MRYYDRSGPSLGTVIIACIIAVMLSFGGCYQLSKTEYSTGYRDGTIQKFSQKGLMFKTHEGEMILGGVTSSTSGMDGTFNREMFEFTVTDPDVVKAIEAVPPGKKVRLHYRQMATQWKTNGDTRYFIVKVEAVGQ